MFHCYGNEIRDKLLKIDQIKIVVDSLYLHVSIQDCLPQILLGPLLNTVQSFESQENTN